MRAILVDWLIDVHNKFKMLHQTLFLTVNLIDRFLEVYKCERNKLQLVGISCLFLASKYEEIYPPDLKEFVLVCDKTYNRNEIIEMEGLIISSLNFDIVFTSSFQFHEMFCQKRKDNIISCCLILIFSHFFHAKGLIVNIEGQTFHLGLYLMYLSTMEFSMARYRPSQMALSAIYLSNKFLKSDKWRKELPQVIGCVENDIKNCSLDMLLLVNKIKRSSLSAVIRKFSSKKHLSVSKIQIKM